MLVRGLDPETEASRNQLVEDWFVDDQLFCYDVLYETFDTAFTPLHDQIFNAIRGESHKKLILAPRGLGKTSICRAIVIHAILYREKHFIVYVSNTLTIAEMQTENIKRELLNNDIIRKVFGDIRESLDTPDWATCDESFSKKAWVAFGDCLVLPRGCDQQIRGLNWNNYRPDLLLFDDPEKAAEIGNEDNRHKTLTWFIGDALQCGSRVRKNTDFIYLDTLKHEDALPIKLMEMGGWSWTRLSICDENYKSYAPTFMTDEEIAVMVAEFTKIGQLDVFYREYMNIPIAPGTASFKKADFRYYSEETGSLWNYLPDDKERSVPISLGKADMLFVENVIIVDPAKSVTPQSDDSAVVVIGVDQMNHRIFFRDCIAGKMYPDQLYDSIILLKEKWKVTAIAVEVTSLNEFITFPLQNELRRRSCMNFELIELKPRMKKEDRIKALIPLYRKGLIYHNPEVCAKLETQLLSFPASILWDVMDATAYLAQLFFVGERFFSPNWTLMPEAPTEDEMIEAFTDEEGNQFTLDDLELLV